MTDRDITLLWLYAAEMWPTFTIPSGDVKTMRLQVWHDNLGDLDQQSVRAALVALASSQYMPAIGAIREKAVELTQAQDGMGDAPDVDEAWRAVYEYACGRRRPEDELVWNHPAVQQAVRTIGWDNIRYSETIGIERAQFFRMYAVAKERHARLRMSAAPAVLAFVAAHGAIKRADDVLGIGAAS